MGGRLAGGRRARQGLGRLASTQGFHYLHRRAEREMQVCCPARAWELSAGSGAHTRTHVLLSEPESRQEGAGLQRARRGVPRAGGSGRWAGVHRRGRGDVWPCHLGLCLRVAGRQQRPGCRRRTGPSPTLCLDYLGHRLGRPRTPAPGPPAPAPAPPPTAPTPAGPPDTARSQAAGPGECGRGRVRPGSARAPAPCLVGLDGVLPGTQLLSEQPPLCVEAAASPGNKLQVPRAQCTEHVSGGGSEAAATRPVSWVC